MLVLSRKQKESLVIDGRVVVTVVEVRGGGVRLAIEAPSDVPVHRQEVFQRIKQAEAAQQTWRGAAVCTAGGTP